MVKSVLIDIDNVIANAVWREGMIDQKGWDAFHEASLQDAPIDAVCTMINSFATYHICLVTGRPEKFRQVTMEWLLNHSVWLDELLMRPNDDFRKSPEMKVDLVQKRFSNPKEDVAFIIDDRLDIIEAFQAIGIPGFQAFVAHVR